MIKRRAELFAPTDGTLWLCRDGPGRPTRGIDWTGPAGLERLVELPYESMQVRSQDVELAQQDGTQVTRKVRVRRCPGLDTSVTALLDGRACDVTRVDEEGRLAYLYLDEPTSDGMAELVRRRTSYDDLGRPHGEREGTWVLVRSASVGSDSGSPTLRLTVRACDYAGEAVVERGGTAYTVLSHASDGGWTVLACREGAKDL